MAEVELRLNTNVVAEGSQNLYYTNARADARIALKVANFALKANSGTLVPTSKLPFTFNPTGTPTEQLLALTYDSDIYQVRSTFAVSTLSDRPAASGATVGHIYHILQNDTAYVGTNDKHVASEPEGDFAAIPARSDLHIVAHLPSGSTLNNATLGDFYFHNGGSSGAWWV